MSQQREKPGTTPEQLAKTFGSDPAGIICSGGMIENFREGWAVNIMSEGDRAHYFKREQYFRVAKRLCDRGVAPARWLYGEGNYSRCKNCERKLNAQKQETDERRPA